MAVEVDGGAEVFFKGAVATSWNFFSLIGVAVNQVGKLMVLVMLKGGGNPANASRGT